MDDLKVAIEFLAKAAPEQWRVFLQMYRSYAISLAGKVVEASPDTVMHLQGRAREVAGQLQKYEQWTITPAPRK